MADNIQEYKCPCCGGGITFDSNLQKMKCPYCDTEFDVETLLSYDDALSADGKDEMQWETPAGGEWSEGEQENMRVWICKSCGGEIIGDDTLASTRCPYCDNPIVLMGQFTGDLRPDFVIPFKLDKEAAKQKFAEHLEGKRLLPKVFKSEAHIDEIKGLYVPFWLFDADTDADLRYRATRVRTWSDSNYIYTETQFWSAIRSGSVGFTHVPVDGSTKMADDLMESIEPYDFSEAVDFGTAYLSGYLADRYDVSAEESIERANERIKKSTEQIFSNTVKGFATVTPEGGSVRFRNGKTRYALYPVWILNTTWNNQKFTFAMNGQTGKFVGDLPLDKKAYAKWFFGIFAAVSAAAFVVFRLLGIL